ncbi:MAG: CopG family transcriptional regulator [Syntrophomonadaceae bacterium]|nr:CopG family transcriptional regulator [Syntrophomonadaceae bacterium]
MNKRLGVVGIVVENRDVAPDLNQILSSYGHLVIGRMGVPFRERDIAVISLIVEGTTDDIGAMTGKLGNLPGVQVKSALARKG